MTIQASAGSRLRDAIAEERPLQVVGAINAYSAMLAERVGYNSLYLSGAGVANASFGLPDLGMTSLDDVLEDVRRITSASNLPLLVDIDTGWGGAFNIARTIKAMTRAGAAAVHIEDQVAQKRCGHRPNKAIVPTSEMIDRIKAAVDAKIDADFIVMARTDALAVDGFDAVLERVAAFVDAGADAIFAEAMTDLSMYKRVVATVNVPVLANITEFGQTPLFTTQELGSVGIAMVLYPLSAFRATSQAALNVYQAIRTEGTQKSVVATMQTRMDLYDFLGYHDYERKLDELFKNEESREATVMVEGKKLTGAGLRGQSAGQTALCTVGKTGTGLTYRGYDISELAEGATFEEVAYLILYGELPNKKQLDAYKAKLKKLRVLPKLREGRARANSANHASDGRDAHRLLVARQRRARGRFQSAARCRRPTAVDASRRSSTTGTASATTACASKRRPTTTRSPGISCDCCTARSPSELHAARDGRVADPLRRARVQRIDIHGARLRVDAIRHALVRDRCDRIVARPAARRRQRSGDGDDREVQFRRATRPPASTGCSSARTRSWDSGTRSMRSRIRAT